MVVHLISRLTFYYSFLSLYGCKNSKFSNMLCKDFTGQLYLLQRVSSFYSFQINCLLVPSTVSWFSGICSSHWGVVEADIHYFHNYLGSVNQGLFFFSLKIIIFMPFLGLSQGASVAVQYVHFGSFLCTEYLQHLILFVIINFQ